MHEIEGKDILVDFHALSLLQMQTIINEGMENVVTICYGVCYGGNNTIKFPDS